MLRLATSCLLVALSMADFPRPGHAQTPAFDDSKYPPCVKKREWLGVSGRPEKFAVVQDCVNDLNLYFKFTLHPPSHRPGYEQVLYRYRVDLKNLTCLQGGI